MSKRPLHAARELPVLRNPREARVLEQEDHLHHFYGEALRLAQKNPRFYYLIDSLNEDYGVQFDRLLA